MLFSCDVPRSLVLLRTTALSWIAWRDACAFFPLSSSAPAWWQDSVARGTVRAACRAWVRGMPFPTIPFSPMSRGYDGQCPSSRSLP